MSTNLGISLKRVSKVYHEGESIAGVAVVESSGEVRHEGLSLLMEGAVNLQISSKNVGIFEAFSNTIKPISLLNTSIELAGPGKIPAGRTEIPFELPLRARAPPAPPALLETYHGVFVNVLYVIKCSMKRSLFNKPLNASCQFFVQHPPSEPAPLKPVRCEITPATIRSGAGGVGGAGGRGAAMPHFQVYAEIHSTVCPLDEPITGKIRVDECSVPIKSIELQLVRVETCGGAEGYSRDATEIQNIQVGDGDVRRARDIPLHMVLPRLFTCPTTTTHNFKIEFELNMAVIFEDDYLKKEEEPQVQLPVIETVIKKKTATKKTKSQASKGNEESSKKAVKKPAVDTSTFTIEERLVAAVWVHERKCTSTTFSEIKHNFRRRFGREPPSKTTLFAWERKLFSTGNVCDAPRTGRPVNRKSHISAVAASVRSAPALSLRARASALRLPRSTLHNILRNDLPHAHKHNRLSEEQSAARRVKRAVRKDRPPSHPHPRPCTPPPCSTPPCSTPPCSTPPCSKPPCSKPPCSKPPCSKPPCTHTATLGADPYILGVV